MPEGRELSLLQYCAERHVSMDDAIFEKHLMIKNLERREIVCTSPREKLQVSRLVTSIRNEYESFIEQKENHLKETGGIPLATAGATPPSSPGSADPGKFHTPSARKTGQNKFGQFGVAYPQKSSAARCDTPAIFDRPPEFQVPVFDDDAEEFLRFIETKKEDFAKASHSQGSLFLDVGHDMPVIWECPNIEDFEESEAIEQQDDDFWEDMELARFGEFGKIQEKDEVKGEKDVGKSCIAWVIDTGDFQKPAKKVPRSAEKIEPNVDQFVPVANESQETSNSGAAEETNGRGYKRKAEFDVDTFAAPPKPLPQIPSVSIDVEETKETGNKSAAPPKPLPPILSIDVSVKLEKSMETGRKLSAPPKPLPPIPSGDVDMKFEERKETGIKIAAPPKPLPQIPPVNVTVRIGEKSENGKKIATPPKPLPPIPSLHVGEKIGETSPSNGGVFPSKLDVKFGKKAGLSGGLLPNKPLCPMRPKAVDHVPQPGSVSDMIRGMIPNKRGSAPSPNSTAGHPFVLAPVIHQRSAPNTVVNHCDSNSVKPQKKAPNSPRAPFIQTQTKVPFTPTPPRTPFMPKPPKTPFAQKAPLIPKPPDAPAPTYYVPFMPEPPKGPRPLIRTPSARRRPTHSDNMIPHPPAEPKPFNGTQAGMNRLRDRVTLGNRSFKLLPDTDRKQTPSPPKAPKPKTPTLGKTYDVLPSIKSP